MIVYTDVLGEVEEELYIEAGGYWSKDVAFRLDSNKTEFLFLAAHSLHGTFETTITIKEINKSVRSGSRLKKAEKSI
ncbi:MAG: hypothetical protein LBO80_05370 [Treponema sp.]|nr:hypothetical protein [Treponema sp.]